MKEFKCSCLLFFLAFALGSIENAFSQSLDSQIDSLIVKEFNDKNGPGGVFMVAKKGKPVYLKAFGKANLELDAAMATDNVFQIGSMTKQFTAIAILMLEEQGKLKTEDLVSKYIPDYPHGDKITLHHLLTHISGIKDFTKIKSLSEIAQKEMSARMMVDFFKNEPADFTPGEKFEYNNSGYVLLGYLIELVSGEKYEDFIKKHIFDKIGMSQSGYASDRKLIPKRAYGYHLKKQGYVNKTLISYSVPFASGALQSTAGDLLKWQNALQQNILLNGEIAKKAFKKYKLNNGEELSYGYGWHIRDIEGEKTREHGGSIFGFKSMAVYFPEQDIYVLGLSNCDCNSPTNVTHAIASLAIKEFKNKSEE